MKEDIIIAVPTEDVEYVEALRIYNVKLPPMGVSQWKEEERKDAFLEGLRRHTWMKDGITYVGNGTYTLTEAIELAERDGLLPRLNKQI